METSKKIELRKIAEKIRLGILEGTYNAGSGHPGGSLSCADIMTYLYFTELNVDPSNPKWEDRDRFVLSKGHAAPCLYAALAHRGFFPVEDLKTLRKIDSHLQGHPDMNKIPGIDTVSGSLGNGVAIGLGMAMGCRMQGIDNHVYVIVGDGEEEEGIIWEAAMAAAKFEAGNLIVFADLNNHQSGGKVTELSSLYPVADKWNAFHWHVQEIDGHDIAQIQAAVAEAKKVVDKPSLIACKTLKGKNIPYMEDNNAWHKRVPTDEEVEIAREALRDKI